MSRLFYYLLFPLRLWRKRKIKKELKRRLKNAIFKAHKLNKPYVCQCGYDYFVGNTKQMIATEKALKRVGVKWTWNKHIVYERTID